MEQDLAHDLLELVHLVGGIVRRELRSVPRAPTAPQFQNLRLIELGVDQVGRLAQLQGIAQPSMSKLVEGLVRRKWVRRVAHPSDRRQTTLELTPQGAALVAKIWSRIHRGLNSQLQHLSPSLQDKSQKNIRQLRTLLSPRRGER